MSVAMEGMPIFLVSRGWFNNWEDYLDCDGHINNKRKHPGPITQFEILDHPYNTFYDPRKGKDYTNRYLFELA